MAEYISRTYYGDVLRRSDNKVVAPVSDTQDLDYLSWVAWCEAGNVPDVDDSMPASDAVVPEVVEARQLLHVLIEDGVLDDIELFIATQSRLVQNDWQRMIYVRRDHAVLNAMASQIGISQEQLDTWFVRADAVV